MKSNPAFFARLAFGLSVLVISSQLAAAAGPYVFFGRDDSSVFGTSFPNSQATFNDFTSHLTAFGVDDIETAAGVNPGLTFGATGITAATDGVLAQAAPGFSIGTQALLELDAAIAGQFDTSFTFNQPITAFGTFVIQGGDAASNPITFRLENTITATSTDVLIPVGPGWGLDNIFFVGFGDTSPFNKVTLLETGDVADGMLYDNVTAGILVPEPSSLVLFSLGAATALCVAVRRRVRNR